MNFSLLIFAMITSADMGVAAERMAKTARVGAADTSTSIDSTFSSLVDRCPIGAGEDSLTFSRMMRNFRFTLKVETLVLRPWEGEPMLAMVSEARKDLEVVRDCAKLAILSAQRGLTSIDKIDESVADLLPRKIDELASGGREKYLRVYVRMMHVFVNQIENIDQQLVALEKSRGRKKILEQLRESVGKMNHQVMGAHRTLSCGEFLSVEEES